MLHASTSSDVLPAARTLRSSAGSKMILNWTFSVIGLVFLTLAFNFSVSGQVLYGISNGFGTDTANQIYRIDPATGAVSNASQITLSGFTVTNSLALAARPSDGVLFAVIQTSDGIRRLVTINPATGTATNIGTVSRRISSLSFRPDGVLYAVTGDGDPVAPETLFTVDTATAALTQQFTLGNGNDGEVIAFHQNGILYHSSGNGIAVFESVDVATQAVVPIGNSSGEAFGMDYSIVLGQMFLSDIGSNLFTVDLNTGTRTLIGSVVAPGGGVNRAIAFVEIATAASATISGRLLSRTGRPVSNAIVYANDQNGSVRYAVSNTLGYFHLVDLPVGQSYVIDVKAKLYKFAPTVINLSEDLAGISIVADR